VDAVDQNDGVAKTCLKKVAKNSRNPPPSLSRIRTRKQGLILDSDVPVIKTSSPSIICNINE
jgi:hypothetical protein